MTAAAGPRPALGAAMIVGAASLWGSLGLFGRLAFEQGVSPLEMASVRAALAFLFVLPLAAIRPRRLRLDRGDIPLVVAYGVISVGAFYYVYMEAVDRLPLAIAAALLYTAPAFVVGIAWAARWEPVRLRRLLPLAMVLLGAFLVTGAWRAIGGGGQGGVAGSGAIGGTAGILFGLASGATYALYTAVGKRIRDRYDVWTTILYAYGIGAAVLALGAPPWQVLRVHESARVIILLMALGPTLLAAILFYAGLRHIDASAASMLATIEPLVAALLGLVWLDESLSAPTLVGGGLIVGAAVLLARRGAARERVGRTG